MELLHPGALAWLVLALPIIALYLVRQRARRVTVATDLFWEEATARRTWTPAWRQLRTLASLLLQLTILVLLVLALTEPTRAGFAGESHRLVIVFDNSAR